MAILWPFTLPVAPLVQGYGEALPNNTIRTGMDTGPAKVRRRAGAVPFTMSVAFNCNDEQVEALWTFVKDTLLGGSRRFKWTHPRTGAAIECRFTGDKDLLKVEPSGTRWIVSFNLEVLP